MLTLGIVRTSSALPSLNRIFLAEGDSNPCARRFISGVIGCVLGRSAAEKS